MQLERPALWKANLSQERTCCLPSCLWSEHFGFSSHLPMTIQSTPATIRGDSTTEEKHVLGDSSVPPCDHKIACGPSGQSTSVIRGVNTILVFGDTSLPAFCQDSWELPGHCTSDEFRGPAPYMCLESILFLPTVRPPGPTCPEHRWCNKRGEHHPCAWRCFWSHLHS